jgi:hypothetical protein
LEFCWWEWFAISIQKLNYLIVMGHMKIGNIWNLLVDKWFLGQYHLLIGGALSFSLSSREIWGVKDMIDPLASFFNHIINEVGLVDISPTSLKPTWRNGKCGNFIISKRIDRFLVDENLLLRLEVLVLGL